MAGGLQTKQIDFLLKLEPDFVDEPWLYRTPALGTERTIFGHIVPRQREAFFDLMDNFKLGFSLISIYIVALLAVLVIAGYIRRLAYWIRFGDSRKPKLFRRLFAERKLDFKKLSALGIFTLCVGQFLWLTQLFLTNNIKVSSINRKLPTTIIQHQG